jgi:hypothetical protein
MPQVGDPVPEKPSALPMAAPFASGFTISAAFASLRPRTRLMWRIALGVLVVVVWLTASFNAPAAFIALSATVQPSPISGNRDVRLVYNSDINNAVMRLYVNGKRWGAGPAPNGSALFSAVADGDYTFAVRAAGLNGAASVWSNEVKLNLGTAFGVTPPVDVKRRDAARLLLQGSFGPRSINEIDDVATRGSAAWIDAQIALPWTPHTSYFDALRSAGEKIEEHMRSRRFGRT